MGIRHLFAGAAVAPLLLAGLAAAPSARATPLATPRPPAVGHRAHWSWQARGTQQAKPPRATGLAVYQDGSAVTLAWHNPADRSVAQVLVRYAKGASAPRTPSEGTAVALPARRATTASISGLAAHTTYSASVWIRNRQHRLSRPARTTFTTADRISRRQGHVTGMVTDRENAPLSGVVVRSLDYTSYTVVSAVTDADGHYTLAVPAGAHLLLFDGANGEGGDSDATGYQATSSAADVPGHGAVTADAALRAGAAVTGRVTDPAGSPVAGVAAYAQPIEPYVFPDQGGSFGAGTMIMDGSGSDSVSAADGTFTLKGLPHKALLPCLDPTTPDVSGGVGANSGYTRRCLSSPLLLSAHASHALGDVVLQPQPGGSVRGVVYTSAGAPVGASGVFVYPADRKQPIAYGGTESDGRYRIDGLAPGTYRVCAYPYSSPVSKAGSDGELGYAPRCRARHVAVAQGQTSDADIAVPPGGAASGTVTTTAGLPVANAFVIVARSDGRAGALAVTDARGHWTALGLPNGRYHACVDTTEARTAGARYGAIGRCFAKEHAVRVQRGRNRIDVELEVRPAAAIGGRILGSDGQPVPGAAVVAFPDHGGSIYFASAGRNGYFDLHNLPPGGYHVCGLAYGGGRDGQHCRRGLVRTRRATVSRHVDFSFPLRGSVQVSVRDAAGHPLAGVDAAVLAHCRRFCDRIPVLGHPANVAASKVTHANGMAVLGAVHPGTYAVCAFAYDAARTNHTPPTGFADACAGGGFTLSVEAGRRSAATVTLPLAGEVTGTVTDAEGNPLSGVQVEVSGSAAADSPNFFSDGPADDNLTAADGTYAVRSVAGGSRTVCFDASNAQGGSAPAGYLSQCVGSAPGRRNATPVTVTPGRVTAGQDIALSAAGGISGTVTDAAGKRPARWTFVGVFGATTEREIAEAQVRRNGRYRVSGLAPGNYRLCFSAARYRTECYDDQPVTGRHIPSGAALVEVTEGAFTRGIDAALTRG